MTQKNLRLDPLLASELSHRAKAEGLSQARIVDQALRAYFDADTQNVLEDHEGRIRRLEEVAGL